MLPPGAALPRTSVTTPSDIASAHNESRPYQIRMAHTRHVAQRSSHRRMRFGRA
jgi:hypothetical protein